MISAKNHPIVGTKTARKIGVRTQHIRGQIASLQEYESLLERDFMTLLRIDNSVESFISQAVEIPYLLNGRERTYTPDVLVKFKPDSQGKTRRTTLFEVKPEEYAENPDDELAAKLAAANLFCPIHGWDFCVVTETDIRTPRLENANFLIKFLNRVGDGAQQAMLLEQLRIWNGCSTPRAILAGVYRSQVSQDALLPDLWTLVAKGKIVVDLEQPITMNSEIWESDS